MRPMVYFPATPLFPFRRTWSLETIWKAAENLPVEEVEVDVLWLDYANIWCWRHEEEDLTHDYFLSHMKRVLEADLEYPIMLSEEGLVFDGIHRLTKAKLLGIQTIKVKRFKEDPYCYSYC